MEVKQTVGIKSEVNGTIVVSLPDLKIKRTWERKGVVRQFPVEDMQEALYDAGFEYMIKQGILSIEDMEIKKQLGLEPEDATEPVNIIILDDAQRKRYLTVLPFSEFKLKVNELPYEQIQALVDYAIENEIAELDKCEFLKKKGFKDIIKAIQLNRQDKEPLKEE